MFLKVKQLQELAQALFNAPYVEFGTRRQKAQPFLRPAGELLNIDQVKEVTVQEMNKALKEGKKIIRIKGVT